jgi:hypothetical protein
MAEIIFNIEKHIGSLSQSAKGWSKELNLVRWNDKEPKYDLRDWDATHSKMGKGITLSREEVKQLRDILNQLDVGE